MYSCGPQSQHMSMAYLITSKACDEEQGVCFSSQHPVASPSPSRRSGMWTESRQLTHLCCNMVVRALASQIHACVTSMGHQRQRSFDCTRLRQHVAGPSCQHTGMCQQQLQPSYTRNSKHAGNDNTHGDNTHTEISYVDDGAHALFRKHTHIHVCTYR